MDVRITKQDGSEFDLSNHDIFAQDFNVGSIPITGIYGDVEGRPGTIDYGADYGQRLIKVPFYIKVNDSGDFPLLRDKLYGLLTSRESYFISEKRYNNSGVCGERDNSLLVGGKRYLVRLTGNIEIDQQFEYGFGEMVFETVGSPFAESIGTSMNLNNGGLRTTSEIWGMGMGLSDNPESLKYSFSGTKSVRVFNPGTASIEPYSQYLKINIKSTTYSAGNADRGFEIKNTTNGTKMTLTQKLNVSNNILIDGIKVTRNGSSIIRNTKRNYITIDPGWNTITFSNLNTVNVDFDLRFYYK